MIIFLHWPDVWLFVAAMVAELFEIFSFTTSTSGGREYHADWFLLTISGVSSFLILAVLPDDPTWPWTARVGTAMVGITLSGMWWRLVTEICRHLVAVLVKEGRR